MTNKQGSVVAVLDDASQLDPGDESLGGKPGEVIAYVRYDSYGVPLISDPADINRDGMVDAADVIAYVGYWQKWMASTSTSDRYKQICDVDKNGTVDPDDDGAGGPSPTANTDFMILCARVTAQIATPTDFTKVLGNMPLYCGYWWDCTLELYHVRHRVYRPEWGKWIQRDPLGYAAGWNLNEYVGGEPWRAVDPFGLYDLRDWVFDVERLFGTPSRDDVEIGAAFFEGAGEGLAGYGRGIKQFGQQLVYLVADSFMWWNTSYRFRSDLFKPFDQSGSWGELYWDGIKAGFNFFMSTATLGAYNIILYYRHISILWMAMQMH